jgi:hypothetical protein
MKKGPPRFSDNPNSPLKIIWPKPKGPPWISNNCASMNICTVGQTNIFKITTVAIFILFSIFCSYKVLLKKQKKKNSSRYNCFD